MDALALSLVLNGIAGGVASVWESEAKATAYRTQAEMKTRAANAAASMLETQADEVFARGLVLSNKPLTKSRRVAGTQVAMAAASGLDASFGSTSRAIDESLGGGFIDSMTIKNNALLEAYGYKQRAVQTRLQGDFDAIEGNANSQSSILTGGMRFADSVLAGTERAYRISGSNNPTAPEV